MQKLLIIVLSTFLSVLKIYGQNSSLDFIIVKETNFFYKDSIDNVVTYGNYEPTGIISLDDGSLVISTKFSITFPDQYKTPETFTKEYFDRARIYQEKAHISSGSVFMLNKDREKQWEVFFRDKRVETVKLLSDETILAVGEDVSLKFFWIAKISKEGEVLDEKEFRFKRRPFIENVKTDRLNNIYILLSTEKMKIINITKLQFGQKKIGFFQESEMEHNIYLLKISPTNIILWSTAIDKRRDYWTFGKNLVIHNSDIFVSTSFRGFRKEKKERIKDDGELLFLIRETGKIKQTYLFENKKIFINNNQLLFATSAHNDTLILYEGNQNSLLPIESIVFDDEITTFWTINFKEGNNYNYIFATHLHNLGCLLIELDKKNKYIKHWKDSIENISSLVDGVVSANNSVVILACHYSNPRDNSTEQKVYSVKLIELEKK